MTNRNTAMPGKRGKGLTREDWELYSLLIPAAVLIIIFSYIPMYGIIIAFQDYIAGNSFFSL